MSRSEWLKELRVAERRPRVLTKQEDTPPPWERETCVMCGKRTLTWLQPENAPLCSAECLRAYLEDPSVYDPRELHSRPAPHAVSKPPPPPEQPTKKPKRRRKPGRWEPDEEWIAAAQERIAKKRRE